MAKIFRCQDLGGKCDFAARGLSEEEVLQKAKKHAMTDHDIEYIPHELVKTMRKHIRDEEEIPS